MMRVAMTADAVGGVWTYALDLIEGFAAAGIETRLLVLGPPPSARQRRAVAALPAVDLVPVEAPLDWTATSLDELRRSAEAVADLAAEWRADLVHLNAPALAGLAHFSAPVLGFCHSCLGTWWQAVESGPVPADFAWRIAAQAAGCAAADALAAPSRAFATAMARYYALPPPQVIRNGRRPVVAEPRGNGDRHGVARVVTVGRLWDRGKDVATLDRAAAILSWPIVAVGPLQGPAGSGEPITLKHVQTTGPLAPAEVARLLASAEIFVSAALYEPFGLAVLEAAQAGAALVLADIPTFRELWDEAAVFVPPCDAAGFAAAIEALLNDRETQLSLAAAAAARARHYSVETMRNQTLGLYNIMTMAPPARGSAPGPRQRLSLCN